jgi:3-oxo-4-pregnene-20-carboxyl-CoA dehydrogenase alpha subunit
VRIDPSDEAVEYGHVAGAAFQAAGGDDLVQRAESDPAARAGLVEPVLTELGASELDVRGSAEELEAAAALCRSAGYWCIPYPVAERVAAPDGVAVDGLVVVGDSRPSAPVAGLDGRWVAVDLAGRWSLATARPSSRSPRESAFVTELDLEPLDGDGSEDAALGIVLPCWSLLGMVDRAIDLTRAYVLEREQFGQRLAAFQGVQFQLTEAEVERSGYQELAKYSLWSIETGRPEALDDALALRVAALEAAAEVFRIAHQLHGAIGFCDETPLSWLSRHSQPRRRLPFGRSATLDHLTRRIGPRGLAGLFSEP